MNVLIPSESRSTVSDSTNKYVSHTAWKFKWSSSWEFILGSLCYTVTPIAFKSIIFMEKGTEPNLFQYVFGYVFLGLPIIYMQIFIGQYTQMGMLHFKNCLPIASGLAISCLINVAILTIKFGFLFTDFLMYFMLSLQPQLPWMECPKVWQNKCFTGSEKNISRAKFVEKSILPSSYIYWRYIYMDDPVLNLEKIYYTLPSLQRIIALCMAWCITFIVVAVSYRNNRKVTAKLFYAFIMGLVIAILGAIYIPGGLHGINYIMRASLDDFVCIKKWSMAINVVIETLALGHIYHMYSGAHLNHSDSAGTLSAAVLFLNMSLQFVASSFTGAALGMLEFRTNSTILRVQSFNLEYDTVVHFLVIPQILGVLGVPQLWSALYFGTGISLLLANQISHLITIEITLMDVYPNFVKYRLYVLAVICIFSALVGFIILPGSLYVVIQEIVDRSLQNFEIICTFLMCFFVFWIYGVTRLSDDIHFTVGSQPTKFWKICWYFSPFFIGVLIFDRIVEYTNASYMIMIVNVITIFIMFTPIILNGTLAFLAHVKKRRLTDLIRPIHHWGPPDPEERQMRQSFNPRKQNRFQKLKMDCHHKCLINSKIYKTICAQENRARAEFLEKFHK